jgi:phage protein D
MEYRMDWRIKVGAYQLSLLDSCEIHKSVDLLADTCTITLPLYAHNQVIMVEKKRVEEKIKRGDKVVVMLGYDGKLVSEFEGYLLNISTDDGSLTLNCEDDLFLLRKAVKDRQFKNAPVKAIAEYLVQQAGLNMNVICTLTVDYDKFVVTQATAYDVLKKIQEELKANIYLRNGDLHIHPPYTQQHGKVRYSFQQNIEQSDLKYKTKEDRKIQVVVETVGADGKKKEVTSGTTGGDKITLKGNGLSDAAMKGLADAEYQRNVFDGFEGEITSWLVPYVEPGYSTEIKDEDFEYKNGWYFSKAVTTSFNSSGAARKVQLGIKLG